MLPILKVAKGKEKEGEKGRERTKALTKVHPLFTVFGIKSSSKNVLYS
jgi:hypothetical protein